MGTQRLTAYETVPPAGYALEPAAHRRDWMDATFERSAYRCLPMLLANQAGWLILNPATVRVRWNGSATLDAIEMQRWEPADEHGVEYPHYVWPASHFGSGIITWHLPYLFRTPANWNLLVRGPANHVKDGIAPLEGLVETDWSTATFTMNWKLTRPDTWVTFNKGEPIAMIVPQCRGELEQFAPEILPLSDDLRLEKQHTEWGVSRDEFNETRRDADSDAAKRGWQRDYFTNAAETTLHLLPFAQK